MSEEIILKEYNDGVLTLRCNRPNKKNAFNSAGWLALAEAFNSAKEDPTVACVVMTGAGADFSSGMDLGDFSQEPSDQEMPFYQAQRAVVEFDKPLIAAAKGIAVGGGATLMLHADIIYVGHSLRMRLPFVSLGLVPEFAASYTLQSMIGLRRANELFFTAEWIHAARALEVGIATAVYNDQDLLVKAQEKAAEIAKWPVRSLQFTKRCLKVPHKAALDAVIEVEKDLMQQLAMSPENIEAVTAIFEKREPNFKQFRK